MNNIDEKGIHYGVIPIRDLDEFFMEDFYDNSENLAVKEVWIELDEIFDAIKEFTKEWNIDKDVEIESLKDSIKEDVFKYWDESEDSRLYERDGYKMQLIENDIFITKSPYVTFGPLCSPCAPGAVYLPDADGNHGFMAYCLPNDFFEGDRAPYEYITIEEGYDALWRRLYAGEKIPELINDMHDLMDFINKKETEETNADILHFIRGLKQNVVFLIESITNDPNGDKVKFYLTAVRLRIGMVNELKKRDMVQT